MKPVDTAVIVARLRDGRMTAVRHFTNREVDAALRYIDAALTLGSTVRVTVPERADGRGVNDLERRKLLRANKPRNRRA